MEVVIEKDDLSDGAVLDLLQEHLNKMYQYSPPGSVHALNSEEARGPDIMFWSARHDNRVIACGALKILSETSGEVKSMKTSEEYLRMGVASRILTCIIQEAQKRHYRHLYLETGSGDAFAAAASMYTSWGFVECEPFGEYKLDPFSRFYRLDFA